MLKRDPTVVSSHLSRRRAKLSKQKKANGLARKKSLLPSTTCISHPRCDLSLSLRLARPRGLRGLSITFPSVITSTSVRGDVSVVTLTGRHLFPSHQHAPAHIELNVEHDRNTLYIASAPPPRKHMCLCVSISARKRTFYGPSII